MATKTAVISTAPLDAEALADISALVADDRSGAVVLFIGNVRNHHRGRAVEAITYTAYESMANHRLQCIVDELTQAPHPEGQQSSSQQSSSQQSDNGLTLAVHHRLGRIAVGETSVIIAASSPHRERAYAASREALERLKAEVPIWKREHYEDGEDVWREEESLLTQDTASAQLPE